MATVPAMWLYNAARTGVPIASRALSAYKYGKYIPAAASAIPMGVSTFNQIKSGGKRFFNKSGINNPRPVQTNSGSSSKKRTRNTSTLRGYRESGEQGRTITLSNYKKKKRDTFATKVLKQALPEKLNRFNQGIVSVAEGTQDYAILGTTWSYSDLQGFAPNSDTQQTRFYVDSSTMRGMITNTTSTPLKLTMYLLHPKKDLESFGDPIDAIQQGLREKYNSITQYKVPFVSPRESKTFISNWKIEDEKTITLSPGENHEYFYSTEIEKYYNSSTSTIKGDGTTETHTYVRGFTKVLLIKILPSLVTDSTKVSFAASKVIYVNKDQLNYKRPQGQNQNVLLATQSNVPQNGLTSEKFMNQDSGDVDTNVTV